MPNRKKRRKHRIAKNVGSFAPPSAESSDFYSNGDRERPLYTDKKSTYAYRSRETGRHKKAAGRREKSVDIREKMALVAVLRSVIIILLLMITFFLIWRGTKLYEESQIQKNEANAPVDMGVLTKAVTVVESFDITDQNARTNFAQRIENWKKADRLVETADALLQRNNYDQAIAQCNDALQADPSHRGALERLAFLYYEKGDYTNAVNTYVRLMSVDPSHPKIQKNLIQSLDALGDAKAVEYVATWYLDQNLYDADVQRYLANALYAEGNFQEAVTAYDRVLRDNPEDVEALEQQVNACLQLQNYEKALPSLDVLRKTDYRNPDYYKQMVVCYAQLQEGREAVLVLGQAAQLFGQQMVVELIKNPELDPIRDDRTFQAFADRVGGEDFRLWLEKMAKNIKMGEGEKGGAKTLKLDVSSPTADKNLLKTQH